jgi:hypothetical protein
LGAVQAVIFPIAFPWRISGKGKAVEKSATYIEKIGDPDRI